MRRPDVGCLSAEVSFWSQGGPCDPSAKNDAGVNSSVGIILENTTRCYIRAVEDFARRFHLPPDRLGPRQIRAYQAELFQKRKLSAQTVATRLAALRFFYTKTLRRAWSIAETPYPKRYIASRRSSASKKSRN